MNMKVAAMPTLAPSDRKPDCGSGGIGASVDTGVDVASRIGEKLGVGETEAELVAGINEAVFVRDTIVEVDSELVVAGSVGAEFTMVDAVLTSGPRVSTLLLDTLVTRINCRLTPSFRTSWQPRETFAKASSCSTWSHPCDMHADAVWRRFPAEQ